MRIFGARTQWELTLAAVLGTCEGVGTGCAERDTAFRSL
jgi:hypothetical protein